MADKTKTIIDNVSSSIVNVKQQCLSSAVAAFVLKIKNADKVVINGLSSDNQGSATTNCSQSSDIEVKSIYGNLSSILDTVIQASPSQDNIKKTFISTLTSAIDINVVTTCFSNAVAAVQLDISNVPAGGTVTFDNVKVRDRATATISSCIQTVAVHVGGKPMSMKEYIDANVGWMASVGGVNRSVADSANETATTKTTSTVPKPPITTIFYCPKLSAESQASYDTDLVVVWVLTFLLGLVTLGRIVYYTNYK
jgi:hypothetical protein